jgi:hypothetical protein
MDSPVEGGGAEIGPTYTAPWLTKRASVRFRTR